MNKKGFPNDFIWGCASAAYQIEGAAFEDGKGPSIWDTFSHTPGKTFNAHTGDVACDAYHRYEEDLDLMTELGITHYRFSISWPRVLPLGRGAVNPSGLDYYKRLVNACLERGIEPWITLYHWDLPQALQEEGGWLNRETAYAFAEYTQVIVTHFKDTVKRYITLNEPQCVIGLGHGYCNHAPGILLTPEKMFLAWHHMMLAHGLSCQEIRKQIPDAYIGVSSTGNLYYPDEHIFPTPPEVMAASFQSEPASTNSGWFFNHQWFLDPVCSGHYPDDPQSPWTAYIKSIPVEDYTIIAQPLDFIALNIYNGHEMTRASNGVFRVCEKYPGFPRTALKWPVTPEVLYWGPRLIYERYHLPIVISENGLSCNDKIYLDGKVHDADRIDFLHRYLLELRKATEDEIPVLGYLHWAFTDNFEWHSGYDDRFGLIYIDYRNQRRIPKDSAFWYKDVILHNGNNL